MIDLKLSPDCFIRGFISSWASLMAQLVKNPPAMQETWVLSLGRSPGEGNLCPLQNSGLENSMESQRGGHDSATFTSLYHFFLYPLLCPPPLLSLTCTLSLSLSIWHLFPSEICPQSFIIKSLSKEYKTQGYDIFNFMGHTVRQ